MSAIDRSRNGSHPNAVATTLIGIQPPKNSPTGPHSPALAFFAHWNRRCQNACLSSGTTAMYNSDITDEGLGRLSLIPRLEGRPFRPPSKIACDPKTRGDCPRFQTDIAVGNVRFPVAPFSWTTLLLPFPQPPTPCRLDDMVLPSPATWQARSTQRHFRQQQWDGDQAPRRGDNPTHRTTDNSCEHVLLPVLFPHNNDNQLTAWQGLWSS